MDWKQRVAETVLRLRTARGWTQQTLAAEADMSIRHVVAIEQGEVDVKLSSLVKLAQAFRVRPADLLDDGDRPG